MVKWLTFLFAIEIGLMPMSNWVEQEPLRVVEDSGYYTTLETRVEAWALFAGGRVQTYMVNPKGHYSFSPLQVTYDFSAGVAFGPVELGFRHVCGPHPVRTYPRITSDDPTAPFEGAYNQIYLRIQGATNDQ